MNRYTFVIMLSIIVVTFGTILISNTNHKIDNSSIVNVDSVKITTIDSLQKIQNNNLIFYKNRADSLQDIINDIQLDIHAYQKHTDSIANELLVAQYKLERIKYYNSIATGNNLKFLRGWINRVIKDN